MRLFSSGAGVVTGSVTGPIAKARTAGGSCAARLIAGSASFSGSFRATSAFCNCSASSWACGTRAACFAGADGPLKGCRLISMACPIVSAGMLAVISVCDPDRPNQAEILSRPSVAASVATVNMNSTSRVVRIKPKYFGFPPTWACIVVIWAGVGLRGRWRRPVRILARRCMIFIGWRACGLGFAVGAVSSGTAVE